MAEVFIKATELNGNLVWVRSSAIALIRLGPPTPQHRNLAEQQHDVHIQIATGEQFRVARGLPREQAEQTAERTAQLLLHPDRDPMEDLP